MFEFDLRSRGSVPAPTTLSPPSPTHPPTTSLSSRRHASPPLLQSSPTCPPSRGSMIGLTVRSHHRSSPVTVRTISTPPGPTAHSARDPITPTRGKPVRTSPSHRPIEQAPTSSLVADTGSIPPRYDQNDALPPRVRIRAAVGVGGDLKLFRPDERGADRGLERLLAAEATHVGPPSAPSASLQVICRCSWEALSTGQDSPPCTPLRIHKDQILTR